MDRVISLLAALVGLIALGGAILVHTNADTQRREMATEIAALKTSISLLGAPTPAASSAAPIPQLTPITTSSQASIPSAEPASSSQPAAAASSAEADTAKAMADLQARIATLEATTKEQASELDAARAQLAATSSAVQLPQVATVESGTASPTALGASSEQPSITPSAITASGPTKDCIPLGTRFMGQGGDSFPLCKTKMVLRIASVTDGIASVTGAGDIAVGATVAYDKGCMLSVFSADSSGFAEMRVTCQ